MKEYANVVTKEDALAYLDKVMAIYMQGVELDIWQSPKCSDFNHMR